MMLGLFPCALAFRIPTIPNSISTVANATAILPLIFIVAVLFAVVGEIAHVKHLPSHEIFGAAGIVLHFQELFNWQK
jgi:hypothetical protein